MTAGRSTEKIEALERVKQREYDRGRREVLALLTDPNPSLVKAALCALHPQIPDPMQMPASYYDRAHETVRAVGAELSASIPDPGENDG